MPADRQPILRSALLLLSALGLQACAQQAVQPQTSNKAEQLTHACQPTETVGFSCQLQDGRLLSLCASPDFEGHEGAPENNPGYAHLALSNSQGGERQTYPPDASQYKKHMFVGVPTSGIPYLWVTSESGLFFTLSQDQKVGDVNVGGVLVEHQPKGWSLTTDSNDTACSKLLSFDRFENVNGRMVHVTNWYRIQSERAQKR